MAPTVLYPPSSFCYDFHQHHDAHTTSHIGYQNYIAYPQYPPFYAPSQPYYSTHFSYPLLRAMALPHPAEMEDFQRLSDDYRADLPGPLIGDKLAMDVLATEYAQADPTYVAKTATLARSYTGYRPVKGDGQCGWRGTVFGYFETLLQLNDLDILQQERVRLLSFEDTMRMAGIDYDIIIDMFDYTWELFDDLQKAVERRDRDDSVILNSLNDEVKSDSIVYHFKMMTSAYMQLRADQYEPFLEMPIADYRVSRIDPANQEIDQIGLQALTDAVVAPANFALEVLYLDRSIGEEATPHPFVADAIGRPTIRLLYRPGHYDLIYKESTSVQVYLQRQSLIPQGIDMSDQGSISGDLQAYLFSGPQAAQSHQQTSSYYTFDQSSNHQHRSPFDFSPHPQPLSLMPSIQFDAASQQHNPFMCPELSQKFFIPASSPHTTDTSPSPHPVSPLISTSLASPIAPPKRVTNEPQIRLNANCFDYHIKHESVPLASQSYGSAATLSPAHFRNQDFQPQIWRAEEEYLKTV